MNNKQQKWAMDMLQDNGYQVQSATFDVIQDNPWASVYRIKTNQGFVFLKCVPLKLSLEARVITILQSEFQANVPSIIAGNKAQHCFLMKDAGVQLHHFFKEQFIPAVLIETLSTYAKLQINSMNEIQQFLDVGVPDWRLKNLPMLYKDLISQESHLLDDGLSKDDIIKLKKLEQKFSSLCAQLSSYNIKDTFSHADFHDKNICIDPDTYQTTIIDLGEVVITYPFFSFLNCLYRAKENFKLTESQYQQLQLACFEPWLEFESQKNLVEIMLIINQCWPIHSSLGEYRLMKSVGKAGFQKLLRQGRFARNLRYWLNQ